MQPETAEPLRVVWISDGAGDAARIRRIGLAVLRGGVRTILLREPRLERAACARLVEDLRPALDAVGGLLLVHTRTAGGAAIAGADGRHAPAGTTLPARGLAQVRGMSVHDAAEIQAAAAQDLDYVLLGAVFATRSHPGQVPLGVARARMLARTAAVAVLAVGGIDAALAPQLRVPEIAGIACIRTLADAADPEAAARELVAAYRGGGR